jgi:hypothetical protein
MHNISSSTVSIAEASSSLIDCESAKEHGLFDRRCLIDPLCQNSCILLHEERISLIQPLETRVSHRLPFRRKLPDRVTALSKPPTV